jgi:hypothetical protein
MRADWRPKGWDLNLSLIRDDLTEADIAALGHQFPDLRQGRGGHLPRMPATRLTGCNRRTPYELWITGLTGCCRCTPHPNRGATSAPAGVAPAG